MRRLESAVIRLKLSAMSDGAFLTGQMLIAMPGIGDPRFERALLLVCAHDPTHAMGLAVNRPVDGMTLPDLLKRLDVKSVEHVRPDAVLMGGPVERERGFVLHTNDYSAGDTSLPVGDELTITATREVLEVMADPMRKPRKSLLALGYAGWGAGQLEQEIRDNVWLTCEADEDLIFDDDHMTKWSRALGKIGVDPKRLSFAAGQA
jgi:putative transcriptional regulator